MKIITNNLKYYMDKQGMNATELARRVTDIAGGHQHRGISRWAVHNYLKNRNVPTADIPYIICKILGVTPMELWDIEFDQEKYRKYCS